MGLLSEIKKTKNIRVVLIIFTDQVFAEIGWTNFPGYFF